MSFDISNCNTPIHTPLTPTEITLKHLIRKYKGYLEKNVYTSAFAPSNLPLEDCRDYLSSNTDRIFTSYIEKFFPIESVNIEAFVAYAVDYAKTQLERESTFQTRYNENRYVRTRDPRGRVSLSYPEVV